MLLSTIIGMPPNEELGQITNEAFEDSVDVLGVRSDSLGKEKIKPKKN